ncbi:MAG TPA: hypothetical protein VGI16_15355 [Candidatus Acidoferrum sp.]|jgi:endogenous inhibitor of DNA gyrase (YacG/DUF329 family)
MAKWVVKCPECNRIFTHTEIEREVLEACYRDPYRIVARPAMPTGASRRVCPECGVQSNFGPMQLSFAP